MNVPFKVTIDDGFCKYGYEFNVDEDTSIWDVAKSIADKFQIPVPEGKFLGSTRVVNTESEDLSSQDGKTDNKIP